SAFAIQAMYTLLQQGISILAPFFHTGFNLSLAGVGVLVSCFNAGLAISSLPSGAVVDRIGERWSVTGGALIACVLVLATLLAQQAVLLVGALLFLAGLLSGTVSISSGKAVFGWFDQRERGLAMGVRQIAIPAGGAVGAIGLPLLGSLGGWQLPLAVAGALQIQAAVLFLATLRDPPSGPPPPGQPLLPALADVLRDRQLVLTATVSMLMVLAQYILLAYLILYLTGEGFSNLAASTGLLLVQLGAVLGRIVWGRVSDRGFHGARRPVMGRLAVLATCIVASLAATSSGWPLWAIYLQLLALGATALSWNGLAVTLMAELGGYRRAGAAIGLNSAAVFFGALIGAPIFGAIVDTTHSYRIAWLLLALAGLTSLIPLAFIREPALPRQPALITP
ncbi:MAG: MFS transporter, partial [Chloroflexota bacterium]